MNSSDHAPLVAIAMLAAGADGMSTTEEQAAINAVVERLGSPDISRLTQQVSSGQIRVTDLASRFSDDEARRLAYQTAVAVCHADGAVNQAEQSFLDQLRGGLGLPAASVEEMARAADAMANASVSSSGGSSAPSPVSPSTPDAALDELILQQAKLTGALEILPDSLANIAILPLQLRMVYQIGQRYGQQLDLNQVKDLAATLGIGAAAQAMEGVVIKVLGGLTGGLLGGLFGGAARVGAGAAVTFAATYALGHVAKQYYAQGRKLSADDLRALFARFKQEANTLYPKVQEQIQSQSRNLNLASLKRMLA
jgi:uncharacterized protein (DUF697 family)/tellurite resistance protein